MDKYLLSIRRARIQKLESYFAIYTIPQYFD